MKYLYVIRVKHEGRQKYALSDHAIHEPHFSNDIEGALKFDSVEQARAFTPLFYTDEREMHPKSGIKVELPPVIVKVQVSYEAVDIIMPEECE